MVRSRYYHGFSGSFPGDDPTIRHFVETCGISALLAGFLKACLKRADGAFRASVSAAKIPVPDAAKQNVCIFIQHFPDLKPQEPPAVYNNGIVPFTVSCCPRDADEVSMGT